jgi:hypothetical protein
MTPLLRSTCLPIFAVLSLLNGSIPLCKASPVSSRALDALAKNTHLQRSNTSIVSHFAIIEEARGLPLYDTPFPSFPASAKTTSPLKAANRHFLRQLSSGEIEKLKQRAKKQSKALRSFVLNKCFDVLTSTPSQGILMGKQPM